MRTLLILFCIFVFSGGVFTQNDTLVRSIIEHSQEVEELGNYAYAVDLIKKNIKKYKDNPRLRKELAGLYYRGEEYSKSIRTCNKFLRKHDPDPEIYQLKSHGLINLDKTDKAEKTLEKGLENLPSEGVIYAELGRLSMYTEDYVNVIHWFEEGIENAPNYPGNFYWAAKIYLESTEEIWGLFYGEIFMNLEPYTSRTAEISKLLYETLNREIVFYNDTAISVNLCMDANFTVSPEDSASYISYGQDIIEPLFQKSLNGIDHLSINNISKFRSSFLDHYNHLKVTSYPNHYLIEFHNKIRNQGHFEAYNFWLYMMGSPEEFKRWERDNSSQWKLFTEWIENYDFQLNATDHYYAKQFR